MNYFISKYIIFEKACIDTECFLRLHNEMGDVLVQVVGPTPKLDPQSEHGAELIDLFVL